MLDDHPGHVRQAARPRYFFPHQVSVEVVHGRLEHPAECPYYVGADHRGGRDVFPVGGVVPVRDACTVHVADRVEQQGVPPVGLWFMIVANRCYRPVTLGSLSGDLIRPPAARIPRTARALKLTGQVTVRRIIIVNRQDQVRLRRTRGSHRVDQPLRALRAAPGRSDNQQVTHGPFRSPLLHAPPAHARTIKKRPVAAPETVPHMLPPGVSVRSLGAGLEGQVCFQGAGPFSKSPDACPCALAGPESTVPQPLIVASLVAS